MFQFSSPFLPKCSGFILPPPCIRIIEEYILLSASFKFALFCRKEVIGQGLNCDEKGELSDEESEETFEEAFEDEPNDENVRFDDVLLSLCVL